MDNSNPRYSVFLHVNAEMIKDESKVIQFFLQKGIKVYWFTYFSGDTDVENSYVSRALADELVRKYVIKNPDIKSFQYPDGHVPEYLLTLLDSETGFNKEQFVLEHNDHKYVAVKAGAGTGKTTVLIDYLMYKKHIDPNMTFEKTAMITFTREAAQQLKNRLEKKLIQYYDLTGDSKYLIWINEVNQLKAGTIHSFAQDILRSEGLSIGWLKNVSVRSYKKKKKQLIEEAIDAFAQQYPDQYNLLKKIPQYELSNALINIIHAMENRALAFGELKDIDFGTDDKGMNACISFVFPYVYQVIEREKMQNQTLEISDLIRELRQLTALQQKELNIHLSFLIVDEFQDTDEVQVAFIDWLIHQTGSELFTVGDIKQSIYRFRGADYTAFRQMKAALSLRGKMLVERSLRKNYRSEPVLLNQLNHLFTSWAGLVNHFSFEEDDQLRPGLSKGNATEDLIKYMPLDGVNLKHILQRLKHDEAAILVRTNQDVDSIVNLLESQMIYCDYRKTGSFYRTLPVRECYMLLRRYSHPNDWVNRYVLGQSSFSSTKLPMTDLIQASSNERAFMQQLFQEDNFSEFDGDLLKATSVIDTLENIIKKLDPADQHRKDFFIKETEQQDINYEDVGAIKREAVNRKAEYQMNLDKLLLILRDTFPRGTGTLRSIIRYLELQMAINNEENELKLPVEDSDRVSVMNVHQAKGMEFNHVIMPINQHSFSNHGRTQVFIKKEDAKNRVAYRLRSRHTDFMNHWMTVYKADEGDEMVAEETRLLYVALTRAKKQLIIDAKESVNSKRIDSWASLLKGRANYV